MIDQGDGNWLAALKHEHRTRNGHRAGRPRVRSFSEQKSKGWCFTESVFFLLHD
jgi:hypothetical protein